MKKNSTTKIIMIIAIIAVIVAIAVVSIGIFKKLTFKKAQNPVATITPYDHYNLLNEQIMYLGYVYDDNGYSQEITTTTLAAECSKFTVTSDDGTNHWYINSDGELNIE